MSDVVETRSIVTEAEFDQPVDIVWRAITDSEWLAVWFFPNDIQPLEGHKFTIWGRPIERWDGEFQCQVKTAIAPRELSFSWKGGHEELKGFGHYIDTLVTWTLTPTESGGTHFRFVHEGFSTDATSDGVFDVMNKGSQSVLRTLTRRLPDLIQHGA
ncbi:SRPBCC domain-containing protein [Xanthobacter autotrophicus]|uniref:SRPBCC family protein n=1 Tax=Xanthobacter TaxID=279 RepID=UPI0024AB4BD5|nr:SRPBCC domain-containing protein [Xanthobacter autotrophicus]MDI4665166.1 SRPBCC domain-containing protein [Xanthobacter autotrophicus]